MSRGAARGLLPIALIDFPMPRKTHLRRAHPTRRWPNRQRLLKLLWRTIIQSRVQAEAIVILLDEYLEMGTQVLQVAVFRDVDLFHLHRLDKTFAGGVVIGIAGAAHAQL